MLPNLAGGGAPFPSGPAAPVRVRLAWAIAVSVALHAAIILAVHPSPRVSRPHEPALTARLVSAEGRSAARSAVAPVKAGPAEQAREAEAPPASLALPAPPAPASRYFLASELQQQPVPLQSVEPQAPAESGTREGYVRLRVLINERGDVDEVSVVHAEPAGVYEKSAIAAFANAKFSPGVRFGAAVKSQLLVEVQFRLENRPVSGRGY